MEPSKRDLWFARLSAPRSATLRRLAAVVCLAEAAVIAAAPYSSARPPDELPLYLAAAILLAGAGVVLAAVALPDALLAALGIGLPNIVVLGLIGYTTDAESLPVLLLWSALASPYFRSRLVAVANLAVVTVGLAVAISVSADERLSSFSWAVTVLACVTVSVTVRVIAERADEVIFELGDSARRDPLTGLLNRRGFDERLDAAWAQDGELAVAFFDLDNFKSVNDAHGHPIGDSVLRIFAQVLNEHAHGADVVGRTGGEEFGFIMPGRPGEAALDRARAVVDALGSVRVPVDGSVLRCTASAGVAVRQARHTSASHLCRDADRALYAAKDAGRNRAVLRVIAPVSGPSGTSGVQTARAVGGGDALHGEQ